MLSIDGNELTKYPLDVLSPMTSLEELYFNNNPITAIPPHAFASHPKLTWLCFSGNNLRQLPEGQRYGVSGSSVLLPADTSAPGVRAGLFEGLSELIWLQFSHNSLDRLDSALLTPLKELRSLSFAGNDVTHIPSGFLSSQTQLTYLSMFDNEITELTTSMLAPLTQLAILSCGNNRITRFDVDMFAAHSAITYLSLGGNNVKSIPEGIFKPLSNLTVLDVDEMGLTGDFSPHLAHMQHLSSLDVSWNTGLTLESRPWRQASYAFFDASGTSVVPDPMMCLPGCAVGLKAMINATASQLQSVITRCLRHSLMIEVSQNLALNNITLIRETVQSFTIILPISTDDVNGNRNNAILQMKDSPIVCQYKYIFSDRPLPASISDPTVFSRAFAVVRELPALHYDCRCSPGYHETSAGLCVEFWTTARLVGVTLGCAAVAIAVVLYVGVPYYRKRQRGFRQTLELQEHLLRDAGNELDQIRQSWQIRWEDVHLEKVIGHGAYGEVRRLLGDRKGHRNEPRA